MGRIRRVALIFDNTARPETTGLYCRRALGRWLEVEHYLPTELGRIPRRGFDLYLNIDDGLRYDLPDALRPAAWWAIDTHLNLDDCREKANRFDHVFAAQRNGAAQLVDKAGATARWLPLACDPEIHRRLDRPIARDIAFVGHPIPGIRTELLARIMAKYPESFVGQAFFDEMAEVYSSSRIVFNRSIRDDINMRVFEGLASGSLLVTNELDANGQAELFQDGTHLVTYRDGDDLMVQLDRYLKDPAAARRIAAVGRQEVLANHTYRHRMERLIDAVEADRAASVRLSLSVRSADPVAPAAAPAVGGGAGGDGVARTNPSRPARDLSYHGHARPELMALIPPTAGSVLDIGCGAGALGAALRERQGCRVVGIEYDRDAAEVAADRIDRVVVGDADELEPDFLPGEFDVIVCGDILEHLREPGDLLRRARRWLAPGGLLVASIPNARHRSVVGGLLAGNWTYESAGLLDRDHVRFFTRREIEKLVRRAGFLVEETRIVPGPGDEGWFQAGRPGAVDLGPIRLDPVDPGVAEEFHTYQYLVAARPDPEANRPRGLTSIIVLTHNELPYTRLCLDSLERRTDLPYELICVDNASTDGTLAYLRSIPGAVVIANPTNRGFPAGVNQGLAVARGEQILLLNNDTVLTTGWLERLLEAFDRDPTIGLVGPSSNNVSGEQEVDVSYRDLGDLDGFAWDWARDLGGRLEPTDRLIGFCLLVRRAVFDAIGPLDEQFGIGCFEDDDLCRRASAAGWRAVIARGAFVHHFGSRTFVGSGADFAGIMAENQARYRAKWAAAGESIRALEPATDPQILAANAPEIAGVGFVSPDDSRPADGLAANRLGKEVGFVSPDDSAPVGGLAANGLGEGIGFVSPPGAADSADRSQRAEGLAANGLKAGIGFVSPAVAEQPWGIAAHAASATEGHAVRPEGLAANDLGAGIGFVSSDDSAPVGRLAANGEPRAAGSRRDLGEFGDHGPRLSACLIVRDNAATLPAALASLRPWVDELIVLDTGSVDETPRIAAEHGATVHHAPWPDSFAEARNESFRHARAPWIFWMDSDDTISPECGAKLRALALGPHPDEILGYVMQVHCPGAGPEGAHDVTVVDHIKLVRNRPDLRFEFRIHEQILPSIRRAGGEVAWTDIHVIHSGSDPGPSAQARKRARDLRLLDLELRDHPNHPFHLFNRGMTHADAGDFGRAVDDLRQAIRRSGAGDSHLNKAHALLVYALAHDGRPVEALRAVEEALALFPLDGELRFRRGVLLHDLGRPADAARAYEDLLGRPDGRHFSSVDRGIGGFKARQNLAIVYQALGRVAEAVAQWRAITEAEPAYRPGWRGLAEALLDQGRLNEARAVVADLRRATSAPMGEADYLAGLVARSAGDLSGALRQFRRAVRALPFDPEPLRELSRALFEEGPLDEAEETLAGLADLRPDDPAALRNLGAVRLRLGNAPGALAALEASLLLRPGDDTTAELRDQARGLLGRELIGT